MTSLDDAIAEIVAAGDGRPVFGRTMVDLIGRVRTAFQNVDARFDADEAQATSAIQALDGRLDTLEALTPLVISVVATTAALPATAPVTQWFRVQADANVYVGNGSGQPLRKIATATLP